MSSQPLTTREDARIAPGTRLGAYQIVALVGRGGMGDVYHARDTRLGRDVALKVLSSAGLSDRQQLRRFEREARIVAALNHPNIASLHGLHEADDVSCLVLEFVPGRTLKEILESGPLEIARALRLAGQVADALHAARERGIVHRDLKPSNVMVTPEGSAKILDFGLAEGPLGGALLGASLPTTTLDASRRGLLVGTPWYMSPEQLRGQAVDAQTDLWAFGCLLFEMLSGVKAFEGRTLSDTIAAILEREPDWQRLPTGTPPRVRALLERCLRKERRQRLHHAADARIELDEALAELAPGAVLGKRPWLARALGLAAGRALPWALALAASALALATVLSRQPETPSLERLHINLPASAPLAADRRPALAISPDGRRLAYVASRGNGTQLCLRRLDQLDVVPIPGTEGADSPVFSPDGSWLAFGAGGKLRKIRPEGGAAVTLADAPDLHGVSWGEDGRLYYAPASTGGLMSVSAKGGDPRPLTTPDARRGEAAHRWPWALPGGRALLFSVQRSDGDSPGDSRIAALSLSGGGRKLVLEEGGFPSYVPTGHLLYARAGRILVAPFDARRLEVLATGVPITEEVTLSPLSGAAQLAFSPGGLLVYAPGGPQIVARSLLWVTRDGSTRPAAAARRAYVGPRLSPDGRRAALAIEDEKGFDLWVQELERDALMRLTSDPGNERLPVWTPDGRRLVFSSVAADEAPRLLLKPADGGGESEVVPAAGGAVPGDVSPDGRWLAVTRRDPAPGGSGDDIWVLPLLGKGEPQAFLCTPFDESSPAFSPDGRWLAFSSNETGREEVYVRPFPGPGGKWRISTEGGAEPRWSPGGGEIFFRGEGKMMAAAVRAGGGFRAGKPALLFEDVYDRGQGGYPNYDVLGKAPRFLMVRSEPRPAPTQLNLVLGWFPELRRNAPQPQRTP